ncbi:MAG: branched-chain amino acid ABC transporter permease [Rhodospirillales bacterium]|nr:branched-chain amino acid ABC transporter permease [Rhodospirillales bacterium]
MNDIAEKSPVYTVKTRTKVSTFTLIAGVVVVLLLIAAPALASRSAIQDLFFILTMLALAQYWNLLAGYAGLVSVGQQAFVGIGGYTIFAAAIFLGIDPLIGVLLAGIVAMILAVPTAFVIFRLRGAYFAIGTWVAAEVFRLLFAQWRALGGGTGTSLPRSATKGIWGQDYIKDLFGVKSSAARDIEAYWIALFIAVGTIVLVYFLLRSRHGLALSAIRDAEPAAASLGVKNFWTKFWIFIVAAFGTGMTGAVIYFQKARISPDAGFSVIDWTAFVVFIVVIGGIGTIEGPIIGVIIFFILQNYLADFGTWYLMLLGGIATAVMLISPQGVWGWIVQKYDLQLFPVRRRLVIGTQEKMPQDGGE